MSFICVLVISLPTVTWSGSPTVSVVPPGSGTCGAVMGFDLCEAFESIFEPLASRPGPPIITSGGIFGLVPGDIINSYSTGFDDTLIGGGSASVYVSVTPASTSACATPGIGTLCVESAAIGPGFCGVIPMQGGGDIYDIGLSTGSSPDSLAIDGDGTVNCSVPPPPLTFPAIGLVEPADDINSADGCSSAYLFDLPSSPNPPILFTLAPGSPTLVTLGATANDVLTSAPGGSPGIAFSGITDFGLVAGDVIDALAADLNSSSPTGTILFSLAAGSPSLAAFPALPSDIFASGSGAGAFGLTGLGGAAAGLLPADDVDALFVMNDGDADFVNDECDNCLIIANNDQSNSDGDMLGDVCDNCPFEENDGQEDDDSDGVGNVCDNCPDISNPDQGDSNGDGVGDACEPVNVPMFSSNYWIFLMASILILITLVARMRIKS